MLKFHSTGEYGVSKAEVFFPNKRGLVVLKDKSTRETKFDAIPVIGTQKKYDSDPAHPAIMAEAEREVLEMLESIRILSPG